MWHALCIDGRCYFNSEPSSAPATLYLLGVELNEVWSPKLAMGERWWTDTNACDN